MTNCTRIKKNKKRSPLHLQQNDFTVEQGRQGHRWRRLWDKRSTSENTARRCLAYYRHWNSNSSGVKKKKTEGKKCFQASRAGGLERFEMPHVALILRVETDSNTASFRNLLYWVSQLLMGFSFDEKKLKCWYLILHIKTLLLIITEKILRVSLLEGLMWKWRVVTWLKTNQKHTWNNANYTKYNLATQRLLLQFTLFGMLKQVFF